MRCAPVLPCQGVQGQSGALNGSEREDDLAVGRHGDLALVGVHCHDLATLDLQMFDVTVGHGHEPLAAVVVVGFCLSRAGRLHQQWDAAELVERKEPGQGLALDSQRGLELEQVAQFLDR